MRRIRPKHPAVRIAALTALLLLVAFLPTLAASTASATDGPCPRKIYGLDFGPYTREGQDPNLGAVVSEAQVRDLLSEVAPYTEWVRTYGCTHGLENVARVAHELGLKVAVGAWLGPNLSANEEQISSLIDIAQRGEADLLVVGSEVMLRHDLTEAQLVQYMERVKSAVTGLPVATADTYQELLDHPSVMAACDVVMPNYFPFWGGVSIGSAVNWVDLRHQQVVAAAGGKPIIISESGWPSHGSPVGNAVPSPGNASAHLSSFIDWAEGEGVGYFYFEAFDEPWKSKYEGDVGSHWGIWDSQGNLKPGMESVLHGLMEGDASGNCSMSIVDAMFIAQYRVGLRTFTSDQLKCADTTDDGSVTIVDAMHIAQWLVDPDGSLGVLFKPLWESLGDDGMLPPAR